MHSCAHIYTSFAALIRGFGLPRGSHSSREWDGQDRPARHDYGCCMPSRCMCTVTPSSGDFALVSSDRSSVIIGSVASSGPLHPERPGIVRHAAWTAFFAYMLAWIPSGFFSAGRRRRHHRHRRRRSRLHVRSGFSSAAPASKRACFLQETCVLAAGTPAPSWQAQRSVPPAGGQVPCRPCGWRR